jgi:hypothetical protein
VESPKSRREQDYIAKLELHKNLFSNLAGLGQGWFLPLVTENLLTGELV